jgi:hypothetical protein
MQQAHAREATKDPAGYALLCADLIGACIDEATGGSAGGNIAGFANMFSDAYSAGEEGPSIPNPHFIANGIPADTPCPATAAYLKSRILKGIGGTAVCLAGGVASAGTAGVNVADVAAHANAAGSTAIHLQKLQQLAAQNTGSKAVAGWLDLIIKIKLAKLGIRGGQAVAALVPAASLPAGIASFVAKVGIKMTFTKICVVTAMEIHWRAYQEQSGTRGTEVGLATQIFVEMLTRRGFTRIFGDYDTKAMIQESDGWQVLNDKMMLI